MRDRYPTRSTVPAEWLVPPELQPDYTQLPGVSLGPDVNVAEHLVDRHVAEGHGSEIAAIDAGTGRTWTFGELADESIRLAGALRELGIEQGDRIAFRGPNVADVLVAALATWRVGAVVVPTPAQARADELRHFLVDSGARMLLAYDAPDLLEAVPEAVAGTGVEHVATFGGEPGAGPYRSWRELPQAASGATLPVVPGDSVAVLWYTGGTTGQPKGCYHTHRRFLLAGYSIGAALGVRRGTRWAAAAPVGHALGFIYHTIYTLLHGATVVLVERFADPRIVLGAISELKIDTFAAIAASWSRMLDVVRAEPRSFDTSSLTRAFAMWQSASATDVYDGWKDRGVVLHNNFGSTAFATWVLVPAVGSTVPRASLGCCAPGYAVVACDVDGGDVEPLPPGTQGRMAVRGPTGLTYWNRPDLQRRDVVDGWTLVDDLITFDAEGNAAYFGRTDYLISSAGYKIAPVEVEQVISTHPDVREVGVIGAPDALRQEIVTAFVALRDDADASDELRRELQALVRDRLSPYKYPRRVEFVAALPRDHVGKLQPAVLREWAAAAPDAAAAPAVRAGTLR